MNRIKTQHDEMIDSTEAYEVSTGRYTPGSSDNCHAFFGPLHYERNYAYPLIVWLHGPGDNENQLKRIMPLVSLRNFTAVAPRGTLAIDLESPDRSGYGWSQDEDHLELAEQRILGAVDDAQEKFNVAPRRIFVGGFRCGGTMAFRMAMNHPDQFAGAISLGGPFPSTGAPLARINESRKVAILLASALDSSLYPPERVARDLRLFYTAGMAVTLRQYPCGDEVTTQMLVDINTWVMDRICNPCPLSLPKIPSGTKIDQHE
jgi:phospholipase/carboxylesterase